MYHNTKAVSVIASTILMAAFTAVLTATVFYWANSNISGSQAAYSSMLRESDSQVEEAFTIEEVLFAQNYTVIYVRNIGVKAVNITRIYVNDAEYEVSSVMVRPRTVEPVKIDFTSSRMGQTWKFKVVSDRGVSYGRFFTG